MADGRAAATAGAGRAATWGYLNEALATFIASPVLFRWGPWIVVKFGMLSGLAMAGGVAALLAGAWMLRLEEIYGLYRTFFLHLPLAIIVGSIIFNWPFRLRRLVNNPREWKAVSFCFYGGLLGAALLAFSLCRVRGVSFLQLADVSLVVVPFFHGLSRLACLNYGCCHGKEKSSSGGLTVRYVHPAAKVNRAGGEPGRPLHPAQIYELAACWVLSAVLVQVYFHLPVSGGVLSAYLIGYGALRYRLEHVRETHPDELWHGLSVWQWISLGLVALGILTMIAWQPVTRPSVVLSPLPARVVGDILLYSGWSFLILFVGYGFHYREVGRWL